MILKKKNIILVIYLAALAAFAPFSTDIYLASMPTIQKAFNTSIANVQLTLSLFFVSFAIAQLFWGPLSDRIGRNAVIFFGVTIFIFGSLLCAWSHTISLLIIARIIQAIGASSGVVMAIAIVKDSYPDPKEMSKILSGMLSVMILAPMIAPIIGSYMLVHISWQSNFYFLAIYGVVLILGAFFVEESYPKLSRKPLPINKLFHAYLEQAKFPPFLLAALAVSTNFSVMFAFISSSSFIYINIYQLETHLFGYFFAINASALIFGSLSLNKLKKRFSDSQIIFTAALISLIGAIMMLMAIHFDPKSIWSIVVPSFVVTYGVGILYPELMSQALKNVVAYNGLASSLAGTCRFTLAAGIGFCMGIIITDSALPLAIIMLTLNIFTVIFMIFYNSVQAKHSVAPRQCGREF